MGTNYYLHRNVCATCGRGEDPLHIGKRSAGWQFVFHGYRPVEYEPPLTSWQEWKNYLRAETASGDIRDEYGEPVSLVEFESIVARSAVEELNHTTYCRVHHPEHAERDCWLDPEGWPFNASEFK